MELLRCLYMMSQRVRAEMEPSVATATNIHRAGLSGIPGSASGGRPVDLSWTPVTKDTSEGYRLMNYLPNINVGTSNNRSQNICLRLSNKK